MMGIPFTKKRWPKKKFDGPKKKPMSHQIEFLKRMVQVDWIEWEISEEKDGELF